MPTTAATIGAANDSLRPFTALDASTGATSPDGGLWGNRHQGFLARSEAATAAPEEAVTSPSGWTTTTTVARKPSPAVMFPHLSQPVTVKDRRRTRRTFPHPAATTGHPRAV